MPVEYKSTKVSLNDEYTLTIYRIATKPVSRKDDFNFTLTMKFDFGVDDGVAVVQSYDLDWSKKKFNQNEIDSFYGRDDNCFYIHFPNYMAWKIDIRKDLHCSTGFDYSIEQVEEKDLPKEKYDIIIIGM